MTVSSSKRKVPSAGNSVAQKTTVDDVFSGREAMFLKICIICVLKRL